MKHPRRLLSAFLAAALLAVTVPLSAEAEATSKESPLAVYTDETTINPDYFEWLKNGGEGLAPPTQDLSYLADSYAALAASMPSMTNRGALPESYDLRDYGRVDPVVNQGDLGVCWAISANSAAGGSIRDQFPQLALSPVHTAWFCYHGDEEEEFSPLAEPYLTGGNDGRAVGTLAAWKGPVTSDKAPLTPTSQPRLSESLRYVADFHLQDAYYMPNGVYSNQNNLVPNTITKTLLMSVGPVSVNYYSHGINTYNPVTHAVYNNTSRITDHSVLVVGWDDNYPKENFVSGNQPQHDGAWLVRNSWGTDWGDDGYFWLSYEDKTLVSGNAYLLESADNYTHNYQYDITGWSSSVMTDPSNPTQATAANIFTAESKEQLEAVSFYTTDAGTSYSISIYTGVQPGQPTSGTCALSEQRGRESYAGYHTIELDEPVALAKGERFSIVVTFDNPSYRMPLAIEWCPTSSPDYVPVYMGNGGESYAWIDGTWQDIAGKDDSDLYYITNVCIKGFTNPLPASGKAVPTVRFSEMEGPVACGTQLSLECEGDADIYWSDGGAFVRYEGPISLDSLDDADDSITIRAYAERNGARGNTVTRTYSRAEGQLTDLAIRYGDTIQHLDITQAAHNITLPLEAENVQIMAQSSDIITIDGTPLASSDWSAPLALAIGEAHTLRIDVSAPGKTTGTTLLQLTRNTGAEPGPSDSPLYPLLLEDKPAHGSILFSPTHAAAGSTVNLTVTPDDGYTLDDLTITAEQNRKIEIRAEGNGRYSFTMPASSVKIDVRFAKTGDGTVPFEDVFSSDWFFEPVKYAYESGLMVGTSDTLFSPQTALSRAMVWATLAREAGAQTTDGPEWYSGVQAWAIETGISDGLRPNDSVSREEFITMLHRASDTPAANADLSGYSDAADISAWAREAMTWGVEKGLISGLSDTTLAPRATTTRAQTAAILQRYDQLATSLNESS